MPPTPAAGWPQMLSLTTAAGGLASFALLLAIMERVVLEAIEANVNAGSDVYEDGHLLLLAWATSQRDVEVVRRVLHQVRWWWGWARRALPRQNGAPRDGQGGCAGGGARPIRRSRRSTGRNIAGCSIAHRVRKGVMVMLACVWKWVLGALPNTVKNMRGLHPVQVQLHA